MSTLEIEKQTNVTRKFDARNKAVHPKTLGRLYGALDDYLTFTKKSFDPANVTLSIFFFYCSYIEMKREKGAGGGRVQRRAHYTFRRYEQIC